MVVNEKALIRAMKRAYKDDGYNVAKRGTGDGAILMIQAYEWAVEITWNNIPAKILALIVEHIKDIPGPCEAYTARDGESATILYSMLDELPELEGDDHWPNVHRTPLTVSGFEVWQHEDNTCYLVDHIVSELPMDHGRKVCVVEGEFILYGKASKVAIKNRAFPQTKPEYSEAKFLSGKRWW